MNPYARNEGAKILKKNSIEFSEEVMIYLLASGNYHYISGHFECTERMLNNFSTQWNFITVLRDPVDRWFSHYFYNKYKKGDWYRIKESLEDFVHTERAKAYGHNYVQMLSGYQITEDNLNSAVEAAKNNLKYFKLVGILEEIEEFKDKYYQTFQRRLKLNQYKRKSPISSHERANLINSDIRQRVIALNKPNQELYEYAKILANS